MDRLSRVIASGSLTLAMASGIVVSASGCRSMRNDVPKGKPYSTNGNPPAGRLQLRSPPQHVGGQRNVSAQRIRPEWHR